VKKSLIIFLLVLSVSTALAQPVSIPGSVYGDIEVNGPQTVAETGFSSGEVVTRVDGKFAGSLEYEDSSFGGPGAYEGKLLVDTAGNVSFFVNGIKADETLEVENGEIYEQTLSVSITDTPNVVSPNKAPSEKPEISVPKVSESESQIGRVSADLSSEKEAGFNVTVNSEVPDQEQLDRQIRVSAKADISPTGFENSDIDSAEV